MMSPYDSQLIQSLRLDDVTDDSERLRIAFDLLAQGYVTLSSGNITVEAVREALCDDLYHRSGRARTLLLTGYLSELRQREVLGTIRIIPSFGLLPGASVPPIEAMELMAPEEGWRNFGFQGFDFNHVVEGGRIAVAPACRTLRNRRLGLPRTILRELAEGAFRIAFQQYGKTQYWAILPDYMVKRLEEVDFTIIPAPQVFCRTKENAQLFQTFDRYWLKSCPRFCRVLVPQVGRRAECRLPFSNEYSRRRTELPNHLPQEQSPGVTCVGA
jgi:hypothetical protein